MKTILRSRLPERLAHRVPPLVTEIGVALLLAVAMTALRVSLLDVASDRAPFALVFLAVILSTVLAGWRSGLIALVAGQLLAWHFVIDPARYAREPQFYQGALAVATFAQLVGLIVIALYHREVARAWARQGAQVDLLHAALREIDHRTANNYQTVLALVTAQARRSKDKQVSDALQQVAERINAIAMASKQLAVTSTSLDRVRAASQLSELCGELRQGLSRPGVTLDCAFDDIQLNSDEITLVSILVNELVTNAIKHAFPNDREGRIHISLSKTDDGLELVVADNGVGMKGSGRTGGTGLGRRLVDTFVKQLKAAHQIETGEGGTRHRIQFVPAA